MSQKPNTWGHGVSGTIGTAGQTVATTKYSVGNAFYNKYGDRYAAITVKSNKQYDFYVFGDYDASYASTANSGTADGSLLYSATTQALNGTATTGIDGKTYYVQIAAFRYILPVIVQSSGTDATVTITYRTFND